MVDMQLSNSKLVDRGKNDNGQKFCLPMSKQRQRYYPPTVVCKTVDFINKK
jgi:hypothetical protein